MELTTAQIAALYGLRGEGRTFDVSQTFDGAVRVEELLKPTALPQRSWTITSEGRATRRAKPC